jgi:hypothetical protein
MEYAEENSFMALCKPGLLMNNVAGNCSYPTNFTESFPYRISTISEKPFMEYM